jgi:hypothetical protein
MQMAVEARRGCGYRKVGGLYLVSEPGGVPCDRLPFALTVCPVCSCGIKQTRGFTWVNPAALFGGSHKDCADDIRHRCPVCSGSVERGGLIWIGEKFYKTPAEFERESTALGVSRRISTLPRGFKIGETWVLLAHPRAIKTPIAGDAVVESVAELVASMEQKYTPGIFQVWKPQRLEKILPESARGSEEVAELEKRGITPVFVPDNDKDHQGSVHDKEE